MFQTTNQSKSGNEIHPATQSLDGNGAHGFGGLGRHCRGRGGHRLEDVIEPMALTENPLAFGSENSASLTDSSTCSRINH